MSEQAVLVNKLPPVSSEPKQASTTPQASFDQAVSLTSAHTEQASTPEVTITPLESVTYYSFLLDLVVFGLMGLFFFGQAAKKRAQVHVGAMVGFGVFLCVLAGSFFVAKTRFYEFLLGEYDAYNLLVRGFCWTVLAPALFFMLSRLIHVAKKDLPAYVVMFAMAAGVFFFVALSNLGDVSQGLQIVFALGSFTCSASLIVMLFFTLGSLPDDVPENLRRGVTMIVLVIASGWFLYPFLNLLSHFVPSSSLYPLLLNLVDLATVSLIAYGFYQGAGSKADRIVMKPAFSKARIAPSTMQVEEIEAEEPVVGDEAFEDQSQKEIAPVGEDVSPAGTARPKPKFRRPAKRMKDLDE